MKKFLLLFFVCVIFVDLSAQDELGEVFLFKKFMPGKVVYKTGIEKEAFLNYNKIDEKMYFILYDSDSTILELTKTSFIAKINIGDHTFEHVKEGQFYEKIKIDNGFLYIRWKSSIVSNGKAAGYGIKSSAGAVDEAAKTFGHSSMRMLQSSETFKTNSHNSYYIKIQDKLKRFNSFKSLAQSFKKYINIIEEYVESENLNFKDINDVKMAVAYCFQISK